MGFLDRLHSIVTATGGALEAPVGFAQDVTKALPELGSADFGSFTHDVYKSFTYRSGQVLAGAAGPEGLIGGTVGQLAGHQTFGKYVTTPLQEGMDIAYHDLVGKPLATAVTSATFGAQDGIDKLFLPDTYAESWDIAEHRSPGQALALAFLTKDIRRPDQLAKAQGTDWFNVISGVTDAASRVFLDPTAIGLSKLSEAARAARAVDTAADLERLTLNGGFAKFAEDVAAASAEHGDGASAIIRDRYFPRHMQGAEISDLLAQANHLPTGIADGLEGEAAVERVTRALAGSEPDRAYLQINRPDLSGRIDRLQQRRLELMNVSTNGEALANAPDDLAAIDAELQSLIDQKQFHARLDDAFGTLRTLPRSNGIVALRGRFKTTDFYQSSLFAKPLHVATAMEPGRWLHLDDPAGDIALARQLEKTPLPLEEQLAWRSQYMAQTDPVARAGVASAAEEAGVQSVVFKAAGVDLSQSYDEIAQRIRTLTSDDARDVANAAQYAEAEGMSKDAFARQQFQPVLNEASKSRQLSKDRLDSIAYDGEDRAMVTYEDDAGNTQKISVPLWETQLPNLHPIVDMDAVKKAVSPIERALKRNPLHDVAPHYLEKFNGLWKPAVLLRPGFTVRFLTDEALRSMSRIGVLATTKNIALGSRGQASEWSAKLQKVLGYDTTSSHAEIAAKVADWVDGDAHAMADLAREAKAAGVPKATFVRDLAESAGLGRSEEALLLHPIRHVVGMEPVTIAGHEFGGAFGPPGDMSNIQRKMIQARAAFGSLIEEDQGRLMEHLIRTGPWRTVTPTEKAYAQAWEHAVNNQIGKSEMGAQLLEKMQAPTGRQLREAGGFEVTRTGREASIAEATRAPGGAYTTPLDRLDAETFKSPHFNPGETRRGIVRPQNPLAVESHTYNTKWAEGAGPGAVEAIAGPAEVDRFAGLSFDEQVAELTQRFPGHHYAELNGKVEAMDAYGAQLAREAGHDAIIYRAGDPRYDELVALDPSVVHPHMGRPTREDIVNEIAHWLRKDPAGRALAAKLPIRKDLDAWVGHAYDQIDSYLPTDELKAAAWQGTATHKMLVKELPNAASRPLVHGGVISESLGGPLGKAYRAVVDTAMENMVGKPSNVLIRNPFFDHQYQAELARQVRIATGEEQLSLTQRMRNFVRGEQTHAAGNADIGAEELHRMELRARRYAQGQTKDLFHDFSEEFSFAKQLGFLSPFANAYGQIMSRWAGIAVQNPAFIRRLSIIWRAPERAGIVTDGEGNVVNEHGDIVTPAKGSTRKPGDSAADSERYVKFHWPDWAPDLPGMRRGAQVSIGKDNLNLLVHGMPPVGPVVQVAVNEIAKQHPEMESALRWALPFGVTANPAEILEPTLMRRVMTLARGESDRDYAYSMLRIFNDRIIDYNLGKRPTKPTYEEVKADADAYWKLRLVTSAMLPSAPQYQSPYQPYIDMLQNRREFDAKLTPEQRALPSYQTPDEWFLEKAGPEFFPLVASLSKSADGIPPTLEGQKIHDAHRDLLGKYPELGSLISGAEGAGEFSRAVYEAQFQQSIGAGSGQHERQVEPFATYKTKASTELGWIKFGKMMDTLDSVLHQRGLTSYRVKAAADLQATKEAYVAYLANDPKTDGWFEDYANSNSAAWDHKIDGMKAIVADPQLKDRPEFQGLSKYLSARDAVITLLKQEGKKNLRTQANAELVAQFDGYAQYLVERNPAFGALYHRWLQSDPVSITPITNAAQSGTLEP